VGECFFSGIDYPLGWIDSYGKNMVSVHRGNMLSFSDWKWDWKC